MKAKDLAELLLREPDAEVVIEQYNGGGEPLTEITGCIKEERGQITSVYDGGAFIDRDCKTKCDIIILKTN